MRILDAAKKKKQDDDAIIVPVLLSPYTELKDETAYTSSQLLDHFDVMDRAITNGGSISKSSSAIRTTFQPTILNAHKQGFLAAAKFTGKTASQKYWDRVTKLAEQRANKVNRWMLDSTDKMLSDEGTEFAFSEARALRAAEYESSRAYFNGVRDAVSGSNVLKEWITAINPCEYCLDNEDDGPIDVDDTFTSGDDFPPAHLNCACSIQLTRSRI